MHNTKIKKKILFVEAGSPLIGGHAGGSFYSLFEILKALNLNQFDCTVLSYFDLNVLEKYRILGIKVIIKNKLTENKKKSKFGRLLTKIIRNYKDCLWFIQLFKKENIDIVHCNDRFTANWIAILAAVLSKKKTIIHQRQFENNISFLGRLLLNRADYIFAVSSSIKLNICKYFKLHSHVLVVHNWIQLKNDEDLTSLCKKKFSNKIRFLWIGRLVEWKGFHCFLNTLHKFIENGFTDFELDLYGEFSANDKYKEYINSLIDEFSLASFISFKGFVEFENIPSKQYDFYFHTSIAPEPFGRTIIEAMSKKIIVFATNKGGVPDIIKHGYNGFISDFVDSSELLKTIQKVYNDPMLANQITDNASSTISQYFSGKHQIKTIETIYNAL